jgi:hypothetical protein
LLTAILIIMVSPPASGKGLNADSPPLTVTIAKNYYSLGVNPPIISSDDVNAITAALGNLGALYDSTWKPAIQHLFTNNSHSLDGAWVDGIGVGLYPVVSGFAIPAQYAYNAYVDTTNPSKQYIQNFSITDPVIKKLTLLNLTLGLRFGLSGLFINDRAILKESFNTTDGYARRLIQFTPQFMTIASTQLPGKSFGRLSVAVLDANVVHVSIYHTFGDLAYSEYFGTGAVASTAVTSSVTTSATTVASAGASLTPGILLIAGGLVAALIVFSRRQR